MSTTITEDMAAAYATVGLRLGAPSAPGTSYRLTCARCGTLDRKLLALGLDLPVERAGRRFR